MKLLALPFVMTLLLANLKASERPAATNDPEYWSFPAEATQLLKEMQSTTTKLTRTGATLASYARGGLGWQTHLSELNQARDHVNMVGEQLKRLRQIQHAADPWQQRAVDSIHPVALNLAARTQAALDHLAENRGYLWSPDYKDHLQAIADHADQMKEFVDLHLDLAGTQDKLEELQLKAARSGA